MPMKNPPHPGEVIPGYRDCVNSLNSVPLRR